MVDFVDTADFEAILDGQNVGTEQAYIVDGYLLVIEKYAEEEFGVYRVSWDYDSAEACWLMLYNESTGMITGAEQDELSHDAIGIILERLIADSYSFDDNGQALRWNEPDVAYVK